MKKIKHPVYLLCCSLLMLLSTTAYAISESEHQKVMFLLNKLSEYNNLTFVRSGSEYKADAAVEHLLRKYDYAKDDLKTAGDFIIHCASRSSLSGKPYLVIYKNGKKENSQDFLFRLLKDFDAK